jgi:DNA-binding NtrC family response regulator/tetratricopeptide (TPR) repeat protein
MISLPADALSHPSLDLYSYPLTPLAEARLSDRQRLAVVLQGAALLAHLEHACWHLPDGFEPAGLVGPGVLVVPEAQPGRGSVLAQVLLRELLLTLFSDRGGVLGRGEGRRAARRLLDAWEHEVGPVPADRAVVQVLEAAGFLWGKGFRAARRALVAEHARGAVREPWLVGPGPFRLRMLSRSRDRAELEALIEGPVARQLWDGPPPSPPAGGDDRCARARAAWHRGRFGDALRLLAEADVVAPALEVSCLYHLGRLGAARNLLRQLETATLSPREDVAVAEMAVRVTAATGDRAGSEQWVSRALASGRRGDPATRALGELVAAQAAWDRGHQGDLARHLAAAGAARERPEVAWRYLQAAALGALAAGRGGEAVELLTRALGTRRRSLARFEAAALWNDLGVARGDGGDLAGAERAFRHALHLLAVCEGPRRVTLARLNLAEVRLRQGRLLGVREALEQAAEENRRAGNRRAMLYDTVLEARYELACGRPAAALALCQKALAELDRRGARWCRAEIQVLAARALGWLGRAEEARLSLAETDEESRSELEPEEQPALFALAGERGAAWESAVLAETARELWCSLLSGTMPPSSTWDEVMPLGAFRVARLVYDAERVSPGVAPPHVLRRAIATFRRLGAAQLAAELEAKDVGPWQALAEYLRQPGGEAPAPRVLFSRAGYHAVRVFWELGEERYQVLVDGPGGDQELAAPCWGGRLVLQGPFVDPPLRALFRVVLRDFQPAREEPPPRAGEMVGSSPVLRRALARLDRFAGSDLPVLLLGESGTGKELAARRLHRASRRAERPFVAVNCAALAENLVLSDLFGHARGAFTGADRDRAGVFETAQGGTVFLDEIGDLPLPAQGMLLRVLQEGEVRRLGETLPRKVDVRVVAATHRDLRAQVGEGRFRQDLYFRLKGAEVALPPLRERGRDVLLLAHEHLTRQRRPGEPVPRLTAAAQAALLTHPWPGNVRELGHVLEAAGALAEGGEIDVHHLDLPPNGPARTDYHAQVEALRRRLVAEALAAAQGNRAEAARQLGLTRQALSYLVKQLGLRV